MTTLRNVRLDITIRANSGEDADLAMAHILGAALPPEASARVLSRSSDPIDISEMGGPSLVTVGQVDTTYSVSLRALPVTIEQAGPRIVQL